MKVLVLGGGVIGTRPPTTWPAPATRWRCWTARPEAGAGDQLRQRRRGVAGLLAPWAGPGVPVKAIKWMLMRTARWSSGLLDPAMWRWGAAMLANCTERLCAEQEPHGAHRRVQPRLHEGAARRDRHRLRRPRDGHAAAVPHAKAARRHGGDIDPAAVWRALRGAGPRGLRKVEPALALTKDKFVGALRLPGDETGDCFKFTNRLAEMAQGLGVSFRYEQRIDGIDAAAPASPAVRTEPAACCRPTATCWPWQLFAAALRPLASASRCIR